MLKWAVFYKDREIDEAEFVILLQEYLDLFKSIGLRVKDFHHVMGMVKANCKFWPTPADINDSYKLLKETQAAQDRNRYEASPDIQYEMSAVERIMRGVNGKIRPTESCLAVGKNTATDYPEYGPSLEELKKMTKQELAEEMRKRNPEWFKAVQSQL